MNIKTVGLDLAKNIFQIHGIDAQGKVVLRKKVRRDDLLESLANIGPALVGMEACAGAHCQSLSDEELISAYKDQQKVERGFRFLKDPMFMASTLFLKSPQRIMALMMVMTLCLLVYAALEHRIREALREHNKTFPDQKGVPTTNPTARWVFQFFGGIHVLLIAQLQVIVMNLNDHHATLLRLLGERYVALYSGNG